MLGRKLVWLTIVLIIVQGCYCSNSTQKSPEVNVTLGTTLSIATTSRKTTETPATSKSPVLNKNSTSLSPIALEIVKIFHGEPNTTTTTATDQISVNSTLTNFINVTSVNSSYEQSWNDTFSSNFTVSAASSDDVLPFRLPNWAAIVAGVCLVSAVIGYISCVSYRRFLQ